MSDQARQRFPISQALLFLQRIAHIPWGLAPKTICLCPTTVPYKAADPTQTSRHHAAAEQAPVVLGDMVEVEDAPYADLNGRPTKKLVWHTPHEIYSEWLNLTMQLKSYKSQCCT